MNLALDKLKVVIEDILGDSTEKAIEMDCSIIFYDDVEITIYEGEDLEDVPEYDSGYDDTYAEYSDILLDQLESMDCEITSHFYSAHEGMPSVCMTVYYEDVPYVIFISERKNDNM